MKRMIQWWMLIGLLAFGMTQALWSQSVSLRSRIVAGQSYSAFHAYCGVEFALGGMTYVAVSNRVFQATEQPGLTFYRYSSGGSVQRVGSVELARATTDVDTAAGTVASRAMIASRDTADTVVLMELQHDASVPVVVPYGRASVGASRVQIERVGSEYLVVVGTTGGRVRVYRWVPGSGASSPLDTLSLGSPVVDLAVFGGSVTALRMWQSSGTVYVAAGGSDGMVYLWRWNGTQLVLVGKAMYHPASVAEIVVNGGRLVVGLVDGRVYIWNYTASGVSYHGVIKLRSMGLGGYSLSALPNDLVAVATTYVRVYRLSDGVQVGEYGSARDSDYARWGGVAYGWRLFPPLSRTGWASAASAVVLPSVGLGNYFVVIGYGNAEFLQAVNPSGYVYEVDSGAYPVYAVEAVSGGLVRARANGEVRAPWGVRNVGAPVFALASVVSGSTTWVLGSYGVGRVFAWSSGGAYIADVLPSSSVARVIYGLEVLALSGSQVVFAVSSGSGEVETWQWQLGSSSVASLVSSRGLSLPLYKLSVNADKSELAVCYPYAGRLASGNTGWRVPIGSGYVLGSAIALGANYMDCAYHPSDPNRLALSSPTDAQLYEYNRSSGSLTAALFRRPHRGHPWRIAWVSPTDIAAAAYVQGFVAVFRTGINTVVASGQLPGYDRSLQEVYEPHASNVLALTVDGTGHIVSGGSDGRVVRWNRVGARVGSSWVNGMLHVVDFAPQSGYQVLADRVLYDASTHALLDSPVLSYYVDQIRGMSPVLAVRGGGAGVVARVLTVTRAYEMTSSTMTMLRFPSAYYSDSNTTIPYRFIRMEVSEDSAWAMVHGGVSVSQSGSSYLHRIYLYVVPESEYFSNSWNANRVYTVTYTLSSSSVRIARCALSPSGARIAVGYGGEQIRVYDRSGSSWNFSVPSSVLPDLAPSGVNYSLKFLADDVLVVATVSSGSGSGDPLQLRVYQLSGGSWVLRQTIDTPVLFPLHQYIFGGTEHAYDAYSSYFIDALAVGSVTRVAVVGLRGMAFYKMTRGAGGVVSLTEVGRSLWSDNGFMDIGGHWVRFSRYAGHNGNIIGVSNGSSRCVVYDLSGLFSW